MLRLARRHSIRPLHNAHKLLPYQPIASFGTGDSQYTSNSAEVEAYLSSMGINDNLHKDVLQSVAAVVGEDKEITVKTLKANLTKADLIELSSAIIQQQKKRRRKVSRLKKEVAFCTPNQSRTILTWKQGESLLDLAQSIPGQQVLEGLDQMEGSCGGQMSCSTCHVYLDPKTFEALPPPVDEELDMIDLAFEPKKTSRLGCQVKLGPNFAEKLDEGHEIVITLPPGVNNEWGE